MKRFYIVCASLLTWKSSHAQTNGTITFGANVLTSSINTFGNKPVYQHNLQTRIGFFASDHVAFGLCLETGINDNKTVPFGFTAFSRVYAGTRQHAAVKFFVEGGAGVAHQVASVANGEIVPAMRTDVFKGTVYVSPGISLFPGEVVAIEAAPEYRIILGASPLNRLGASVGLKFFLSEELFTRMFPHTFVRNF